MANSSFLMPLGLGLGSWSACGRPDSVSTYIWEQASPSSPSGSGSPEREATSSGSGASGGSEFKVPASVPAHKRQRSPEHLQQQHQQQLEAKRQRQQADDAAAAAPPPAGGGSGGLARTASTVSTNTSAAPAVVQQQLPAVQPQQPQQQVLSPRFSSSLQRPAAALQQQPARAGGMPPLPPKPLPASAAARSSAIDALKQQMLAGAAHTAPAADTLLCGQAGGAAAAPALAAWSGCIKHRVAGRAVEVCSATLQVPDAFLEEFPRALYAAEIRHRRGVSLGRHVVCRASLAPAPSRHQLASLAAMAREQLVMLCSLQTGELHLVPYFDNRNSVRLVGFLRAKPGVAA